MLKTFSAAAVTLALLVGPAVAQEASGAAVVSAQLDAVTDELGLTPGARVTGRLAASRTQITNIEVPGGEAAVFIGACDENCSDLDLIVRDSAGREVGRDTELDDVPIVAVQATAGTYTVEVTMVSCTANCHWGVGVFR